MTLQLTVLCLSAAAAGAVNSVAGGGTLLTFPVLFEVLGGSAAAAVLANGTSTVALLPGSLAGAWAYRAELAQSRSWLILLTGPSLLGGCVGALLVTVMPAEWFKMLVPWLILAAAALFALQPQIAKWTGIGKPHATPTAATMAGVAGFQFLVAVYGGYFGAGIGILMLAALAMMGLADIHHMNGLKTIFASCINGVAAAVFILQGAVHWPVMWPMALAAIAGGYLGAATARRLNRNLVRTIVIGIGFALAGYNFLRQIRGGT